MDKPGFLGSERLAEQRAAGPPRKRLVSLVLSSPEPVLWGGERFYRDGAVAGFTTSGAYGHTVGAAVGLGYVHADEPVSASYLADGSFEVDVAGDRVEATASLGPLLDPERARILR